ncbi:hypothetical protein JTE90_015995 [Oedothorax gibbosus]|uniref:Uncharacterized protein n=1 Tax=Oedothorax gibbosus TaxID=931172 RepID=A0AAV6VTX0_9ARAC|nr:hypothetical protein JTE90_015995 [Oedothorax gibbosus]
MFKNIKKEDFCGAQNLLMLQRVGPLLKQALSIIPGLRGIASNEPSEKDQVGANFAPAQSKGWGRPIDVLLSSFNSLLLSPLVIDPPLGTLLFKTHDMQLQILLFQI